MPTHTDWDFELDTDTGYLSGAEATFQYRPTYSRGDDFRGWDVEDVELIDVRIGGLHLTRDQIIQATSAAEVDAIESRVSEQLFELQRAGEMEVA